MYHLTEVNSQATRVEQPSHRQSFEGIFFIFCQLCQHPFEAVHVDDGAVGDGAPQSWQLLLVCVQQHIQPTGTAIDLQARNAGQEIVA